MTVSQLASESEADLDEVLVALWDAGVESVETSGSTIPRRQIRQARAALGLDDPKEQFSVGFWLERSGLTREELADLLREVGVELPTQTRRIPRNSLRRLRQLFPTGAGTVDTVTRPADSTMPRAAAPPKLPTLVWETVGTAQASRHLTPDDVARIHVALEEDFAASGDPIVPGGIKNRGLLESAVHRPFAAFGNVRKYPTVEMAAAALFHSLVLNHAFHNGNKRAGLVSLLAFLDMNDRVMTCSESHIFRFTLRVAQHGLVPVHADLLSDRETLEIARWIRSNTRTVQRHERPMKWLRLRQRLRDFGCECTTASVGNRLNIVRTVSTRGRFGREKMIELRTQVAWSGDGADADRSTLHKIRADLHLDDLHDVDSTHFYEGAELDQFIIDYRRILRRLSRL